MNALARLVWSIDAKRDIQRLHAFLALANPVAADDAVEEILNASAKLSVNPEIGRPYNNTKPFRELVVPFGSRAYIIRYRYLDGTVFIVKLWHGSEDRL